MSRIGYVGYILLSVSFSSKNILLRRVYKINCPKSVFEYLMIADGYRVAMRHTSSAAGGIAYSCTRVAKCHGSDLADISFYPQVFQQQNLTLYVRTRSYNLICRAEAANNLILSNFNITVKFQQEKGFQGDFPKFFFFQFIFPEKAIFI